MADRDPATRRLRLGMEIARLVPALLAGIRLPEVARPHCMRLASEVQETVNVGDPRGCRGRLPAERDGGPAPYLPGLGGHAIAGALHGPRQVPSGPAAVRRRPGAARRGALPPAHRPDADGVAEARLRPGHDPRGRRRHLGGGVRGRTGLDRGAVAAGSTARARRRSTSRCPRGARPRSSASS